MSGIILITVPMIQYGGYFLLTSLMSKTSGYMDKSPASELLPCGARSCRRHCDSFARLSDTCGLSGSPLPTCLVGPYRSASLSDPHICGILFLDVSPAATEPSGAVRLIYGGAVILAISLITLAVGLIRTSASA
jgi:hypothetical protein